MSTTVHPVPPLPPAPVPTRSRSVAAIVIGSVLLVAGFLTAASGVALIAMFGDGGKVASDQHVLSTPTPALVADLGNVRAAADLGQVSGPPILQIAIDSAEGSETFVGIARVEDVDRYLGTVSHDRAVDFELSPFELTTAREQGAVVAARPGVQSFWAAQVQTDADAELTWHMNDGHYEVVVMNADGSAGVSTRSSIGISLPDSAAIWILVIGVGVGLVAAGGVLVLVGARREPVRLG